MARKRKLGKEEALELKGFLTLSPKERQKLSEEPSNRETIVAASKLLLRFDDVVADRVVARQVLRQLLYFAEFARINRCSIEDAVSATADAIDNHPAWQKDEAAAFSDLRPWIAKLAASVSVGASAKALTLSYDTERAIIGLRTILDIRPVYDNTREQLIGAVVLNTLRMDFSEAGEVKTYSFAVTLDELKNIRTAVDDAIRKSAEAQRWLSSPNAIPSFTRGEEKYGFD